MTGIGASETNIVIAVSTMVESLRDGNRTTQFITTWPTIIHN
jgi:hypothetical protein